MQHDVFISYSTKDKHIADAICSNLEANGLKCWYAPRDILAGDVWEESIMKAISCAKYFVIIFSEHSNQSKQVSNEVAAAFNAKCIVFPFRVDDIKNDEIEKRLAYYLTGVHWMDAVNPPLIDHIQNLYEQIRVHEKESEPFVAVPISGWRNRFYRRKARTKVKATVIAVVLCTALISGILFFKPKLQETTAGTPVPQQIADENNSNLLFDVSVGDTIEFGAYQGEPIEWRVLEVEDDDLFLVSEYCIDKIFYNDTDEISTWESCCLRNWLNTDFYDIAFSDEEQALIQKTQLENLENPMYPDSCAGGATEDRIFVLDVDQVLNYFPTSKSRCLKPMNYLTLSDPSSAYSDWWVRNPGGDGVYSAVCVGTDGEIDYMGWSSINSMGTGSWFMNYGVRPAMHIKNKSVTPSVDKRHQNPDLSLLDTAQKGSIVEFGCYEQDNDIDNGKEPVEWIVLDRQEDKLLLISRYCIDSQAFSSSPYNYSYWFDSSIRSWLNFIFYFDAFSKEERLQIDYTGYKLLGSDGSENMEGLWFDQVYTHDKIFLLNAEEAQTYFTTDESRCAEATEYAQSESVQLSGDMLQWGLRSKNPDDASWNQLVKEDGSIDTYGTRQCFATLVRPAMWLNLGDRTRDISNFAYSIY